MNLVQDFSILTMEDLFSGSRAKILCFEEVLNLLVSPDNKQKLQLIPEENSFYCEGVKFPIINGNPILYPSIILEHYLSGGLKLDYYKDARLQYYLISQIKQQGEINAPSVSVHYQRHLYRFKNFVENIRGLVLDIGCDDVTIGSSLFSDNCEYVGLDPFSTTTNNFFKVVGMGESLPFSEQSFDAATFNTSLDHLFDYHTGINEAFRVLKKGGILIIATLIWTGENASLLNDSVHFHHFREHEILMTLEQYGTIEKIIRYPYKDEGHRYGLYVQIKK